MKRISSLLLAAVMLMSLAFGQQEIYKRTLINVPSIEPTGFGNFVSGVDLDGDGLMEVYAVNNNWNDAGDELIPRIYKFERQADGSWPQVWSATLPIPAQNTWPALVITDLDGDGRKEVTWGPVNFTDATTNPNPARIIVFESVPGKDTLGVPDGSNFKPNTQWTITTEATKNIRPFKFMAHDFNNDGKDELVFSDRANSIYRFGVVGVSAVPDNGDTAGVVWSFKYEGLVSNANINTGTYYDFNIIDSTIFFINTNGNVQAVTYANGTYTLRVAQTALIPGGSWKTSAVVDLDGTGSKELMAIGWTATAANKKVRVFQKTTDSTLTEATNIDVSGVLGAGGQAYGGAVGDVDNDGKPDYIFGSRDASAKVFRVEYQGGGISTAANYTVTEIDRNVVTTATRQDVFVANVDGVAGDEVLYSSSVDGRVPIVVLSDGGKAVNVTFTVNTATIPDTIKSNSTVQMRGDDGNLLRWDGGTGVKFSNVTSGAGASDFWKVTGLFKAGQTFPYKIFTNVNPNVGPSHPQEHNGWEKDITDHGNGNRQLIVGQNDTIIKLQFVNGSPANQMQFWRPYPESDSIEVHFRVNMANVEDFNPATMKMGVRGSQAPLEWGKSFFLTQEQNDGNNPTRYPGNNFWSGTLKLPMMEPYANNDTITVYYKFVQHLNTHTATDDPVKWEDGIVRTNSVDIEPGGGSNPARIFMIKAGMQDTTLYWKWWANQGVKPPLGNDTAYVTFRVNMLKAINTNSYTIGDTVQVRHGFANSATTVKTKNLTRLGSTFIYTAVDTVYGTKIDPTANLVYQYYLIKDAVELREVYYNFEFTGSDVSLAERRLLPMTAKTLTAADTSTDPTKATRQPFWRNTRKLSQVVNVKFTVDLRPAYYQVKEGLNGKDTLIDIQGPWTLNKSVLDSIYKWGVSINGPATGGWATWGATLYADTTRKMYDDGTHGDAVAGDRVYTRHYVFGPDSINGRNLVGQEFKFGIRGGDNEGGKGGFGNNHIENINDGSSTATINSYFGSINPSYYDRFNFEIGQPLTNVRQDDAGIPIVFALEQNYPNPFNPNTTINYDIPTASNVTLKVYNMLGQEVAVLVNGTLNAGRYNATFNASRLASGVYIYRLEAGSFTSVKKMMLLK
jgi:hypothetical protein